MRAGKANRESVAPSWPTTMPSRTTSPMDSTGSNPAWSLAEHCSARDAARRASRTGSASSRTWGASFENVALIAAEPAAPPREPS